MCALKLFALLVCGGTPSHGAQVLRNVKCTQGCFREAGFRGNLGGIMSGDQFQASAGVISDRNCIRIN